MLSQGLEYFAEEHSTEDVVGSPGVNPPGPVSDWTVFEGFSRKTKYLFSICVLTSCLVAIGLCRLLIEIL